jgi:hypothetical protein
VQASEHAMAMQAKHMIKPRHLAAKFSAIINA